jgi:hypothetical protein
MTALMGARLFEAVVSEAERLKGEGEINPVGEKTGAYGKYFKDGHKYVYSLEELDFVLGELEYMLSDASLKTLREEEERLKERYEDENHGRHNRKYDYDRLVEEEKEYIESDGSGIFPASFLQWGQRQRDRQPGYIACHLRGYLAAFSEDAEKSEDELNPFFDLLGDWSASMRVYSQAGRLWRKKNREKVEKFLTEYAREQVIDGLSGEEIDKYVGLRVRDELKAFEQTIGWVADYINSKDEK